MRKYLLVFCLAFLLLLCGCGDQKPESTATEPDNTTAGAGSSLEAHLTRFENEYSALSEEARQGITEIWMSNDFSNCSPSEVIDRYSAYVSRDAAEFLYFWNSRACVEYVKQNYGDTTPYLDSFSSAFDECLAKYPKISVEDLNSSYEAMRAASLTEYQQTGTARVGWIISYCECQAAEDAAAFFNLMGVNDASQN